MPAIPEATVASTRRLGEDERGTTSSPSLLLRTKGLSKQYPGTRALDNLDFTLRSGEVHVLFGENGAGKSTLISMLAGAVHPTSGTIFFKEEVVRLQSVKQARNLGISAVFQEFSLIPEMTVAENLCLGAEPVIKGLLSLERQHEIAKHTLARLEFDLDPMRKVSELTRAQQQMVEIAKAFRTDLSVLILDEPTASLTDIEAQHLFHLITKLKTKGVGIIYITHRMSEIQLLGDRITVLRDGKFICTEDANAITSDQLVEKMTGRVIGQIFPHIEFAPQDIILQADKLTTSGANSLCDISFNVRKGEIVGFAGLVGSGKSEAAQACFGAVNLQSGSITFKGRNFDPPSPASMLKAGCIYLPADRHQQGIMLMRPARENITLPAHDSSAFYQNHLLNRRAERMVAHDIAEKFQLSPLNIEIHAELFSGGNQQKLMLARSLTRDFDLFIFDEPTVGVDLGTRAAIYAFIKNLCEAGAAIVLVSSDLPEILHLTCRSYVFYQGHIQAELSGDQITEKNVLSHFFEQEG